MYLCFYICVYIYIYIYIYIYTTRKWTAKSQSYLEFFFVGYASIFHLSRPVFSPDDTFLFFLSRHA